MLLLCGEFVDLCLTMHRKGETRTADKQGRDHL